MFNCFLLLFIQHFLRHINSGLYQTILLQVTVCILERELYSLMK